MIQDTKAYNKIRKAKTSLILQHPFFATLALKLNVKEDYSCHTAWTDGTDFGYNPNYVNMLSSKKLEGMTAHIVMHPACNHHTRRDGRDKNTWNKACDYVINGILLDAGFTLPDGYLYREEYCERSAESVYRILDGEEDAKDIDDPETSIEQEEEDSEQSQVQEEQEQESKSTDNSDDTNSDEEGDQNHDPGMSGEIRDGEGNIGSGEDSGQDTEWDDAVIQAAINAKGIGKLPSALARMLNRRFDPYLDWRELLARFVAANARSDYSWITPNRRYIHRDIYLPSLSNCELDNVVIAIDTSGSISDTELEQFGAEISEIFSLYPANIHLMYCDNRLQSIEQAAQCDLPIRLEPKGGGGTDYRPVFQHVEDNQLSPSCLIYLTDLECKSFPPHEPYFPVLWVKTGSSKTRPPFGETINI